MEIPEGDHAVFAVKDVLFPNDAPVEVSAKISDCLVAVSDVFAVNNPLFRTIFGHAQTVVNKGLQEPCPEDLCQGFVVEKVPGRFHPPQSGFCVDACPGHDNMNVRMIIKGS